MVHARGGAKAASPQWARRMTVLQQVQRLSHLTAVQQTAMNFTRPANVRDGRWSAHHLSHGEGWVQIDWETTGLSHVMCDSGALDVRTFDLLPRGIGWQVSGRAGFRSSRGFYATQNH